MAIYAVYTFDASPATVNTSGEVHVYDDPGDHSNLITSSGFSKISDLLDVGFYYVKPPLSHPLIMEYLDGLIKTSLLNNDAGFISNVTTALGYTPVSTAGARSAVSLTTTGSGAASYNSSTGVLNVPNYTPTKRTEIYSGTTNASGVYTVTFPTAFSVAPNIQASITNQSSTNQYLRVSSISTTGFTIHAYSFSTNNLLGIISLISTTVNINGATIDVLVTEK